MLSSSHPKIHEPHVTGVSPRTSAAPKTAKHEGERGMARARMRVERLDLEKGWLHPRPRPRSSPIARRRRTETVGASTDRRSAAAARGRPVSARATGGPRRA